MKIKIIREIDIPDSFRCGKCSAQEVRFVNGKLQDSVKNCCHFNDVIFWKDGCGWVKCRACVESAMDYLNGVTK